MKSVLHNADDRGEGEITLEEKAISAFDGNLKYWHR